MEILNNKKGFSRSHLFPIFGFIILSSLYACGSGGGGDSPKTGSISFALDWKTQSPSVARNVAQSPSGDVCVDYKIELISVDIFDSSNAVVASDSFPCSAHQGTINEIPAGSGLSLIVEGTIDSGDIDWRGEIAGITITDGENTDVGTVDMIYVGDDTTPPKVVSTTPDNGDIDVVVDTVITAELSEAMVSASVNASTFIIKAGSTSVSGAISYNPSTLVATLTPNNDLSFFTTYTATITTEMEDIAGIKLEQQFTWSFRTERGPLSWDGANWDEANWN